MPAARLPDARLPAVRPPDVRLPAAGLPAALTWPGGVSQTAVPAPRPARPGPRVGRSRTHRPLLVAALALLAVLTAGAAPASAHDQLVESQPASGEALTVSPPAVVLRFNEKVSTLSSEIVVTDAAGQVAADAEAVIDGSTATLTLPGALADGAYTVTWRVVSGDGHPVQGTFPFTVAVPAAATTPAPGPAATPTSTPTSTATTGPTATPEPTSSTGVTSAPAAGNGTRLPLGWLAAVLVVLVAATAVVIARRRRARA